MRPVTLLWILALFQAPPARGAETDDPREIPPTAHASPSGPAPDAFDGKLPAGHPPLPAGHPAVGGGEALDGKQLLQKLDSMKDELKGRPKTAEIEYALGNLYYENGRYPEAIDFYRQLLARAEKPMADYLAARKRAGEGGAPLTPEQAGCPSASHPSFDQLVAIGEAKAAAKDYAAAVTCYETALLPVVAAKARRANAFFLIGNPDRAAAEQREVLAIEPGFTDSLFFLGAMLYETGDGDPAKLREAQSEWRKFLRADPDADRAKLVTDNLALIDVALRQGGKLPSEPGQRPRGPGMGPGPIEPPEPPPGLSAKQQRELEAAVRAGQRLLEKRSWAEALVAFDRGRKLDRADAQAATGAGIALLNLGQRLDAEAALRDALGRDPADGLALYELGELFFEGQHFAGAARFWSKLLKDDPKTAERYDVRARLADAQARPH